MLKHLSAAGRLYCSPPSPMECCLSLAESLVSMLTTHIWTARALNLKSRLCRLRPKRFALSHQRIPFDQRRIRMRLQRIQFASPWSPAHLILQRCRPMWAPKLVRYHRHERTRFSEPSMLIPLRLHSAVVELLTGLAIHRLSTSTFNPHHRLPHQSLTPRRCSRFHREFSLAKFSYCRNRTI